MGDRSRPAVPGDGAGARGVLPAAAPCRARDDRLLLPAGTVTFLFTDIEDSTFLTRVLGDEWPVAHADHRRLVRAAAIAGGGQEVDTQGDSFFFAFARAHDAAAAAIAAQTALASHPWPGAFRSACAWACTPASPHLGAEGYLGLDVVRGARVCAIAEGGEVLLSETTHTLLRGDELPGARLEPLGVRRLKGPQRGSPALPARDRRPLRSTAAAAAPGWRR